MISQSICHGSVVRARAWRCTDFTKSISRFSQFFRSNNITLYPTQNFVNEGAFLCCRVCGDCSNSIGMNRRWQLQRYCQVNIFSRFTVQLLTLRQGRPFGAQKLHLVAPVGRTQTWSGCCFIRPKHRAQGNTLCFSDGAVERDEVPELKDIPRGLSSSSSIWSSS